MTNCCIQLKAKFIQWVQPEETVAIFSTVLPDDDLHEIKEIMMEKCQCRGFTLEKDQIYTLYLTQSRDNDELKIDYVELDTFSLFTRDNNNKDEQKKFIPWQNTETFQIKWYPTKFV